MPNHPAQRNPNPPGKEDGDPRAGEETCTTTLRRSRAGPAGCTWEINKTDAIEFEMKGYGKIVTG